MHVEITDDGVGNDIILRVIGNWVTLRYKIATWERALAVAMKLSKTVRCWDTRAEYLKTITEEGA